MAKHKRPNKDTSTKPIQETKPHETNPARIFPNQTITQNEHGWRSDSCKLEQKDHLQKYAAKMTTKLDIYEEKTWQKSFLLPEPGVQHSHNDKSVQNRDVPEISSMCKKGSGRTSKLFGLLTIYFLLVMTTEGTCSAEVKRAPVAIHTSPFLIHWTSKLYFKCRLQKCFPKKAVNTNVHERCSEMTVEIKEQLNITYSRKGAELLDTASSIISNGQTNVTAKSTANVLTGPTSLGKSMSKTIVQSTIPGMLCLFTHWTNSTETHNTEKSSDAVGYNSLILDLLIHLILTISVRLLRHAVTSETLNARKSKGSYGIQAIHNNERERGSEETIEKYPVGELRTQRLSAEESTNKALNVGESTPVPKPQCTRESIPTIKNVPIENSVSDDTRLADKSILTTEIKHEEQHAITYTGHKGETIERTDTEYTVNCQFSYSGNTEHTEELYFTTKIIAEDVLETSLERHKEETPRRRGTRYTGDSYLTNHTKPTEDFSKRDETGHTGIGIENKEKCKKSSDKNDTDKSNATDDKNGVKQQRTTDIRTTDDENTVKHYGTTKDENEDKLHGTTDTRKVESFYGTDDYIENEEINKRSATKNIRKHYRTTENGHAGECCRTTDTEKKSEKSNKPAATRLTGEHLRTTDTVHEKETSAYAIPTHTNVHIRGTADYLVEAQTEHTNDKCGALETATKDVNHEKKDSCGIILNETARHIDTSIETEHSGESRDHSSHYGINTNEGLFKEADNVNFKGKSRERIHDLELRSNNSKGIPASTSNTTSDSDIQEVIKDAGACPLHDSVGMSANMTIVYQNITEEVSVITTVSANISSVDNQNENTAGSSHDSEEETMVNTLSVDSLKEFAEDTLLDSEANESDEESLDESVTEIYGCCTSESTDIWDSLRSSSITTSDEITEKICQEQHSGEDRMIEMREYVSNFFESEVEEKRPAKTLDSFSNYCNLQKTHNINGQGMDALPMHRNSKKKKAVIPPFDERKVWIAFFVSNYFNRHNQIRHVLSIRSFRAATRITQDLSNLWDGSVVHVPLQQHVRNEDQTFNNSPNVEPVSGAIGYPDAGRRSRDSEITEITNDVFYTICCSSVTESMRFEWGRFKSFWSFPMDCPALPTVLAKYGFYYTGNRDEVVCFSCHITHSNWNRGDSVYAVHYQISGRCRFMNGKDVGNVPIHGPLSCLSQRAGGRESAEEIEMRSLLSTPETAVSLLLEEDQANQVVDAERGKPSLQVKKNQTENNDGSQVGDSSMETSNSEERGGGSKFSLAGFQAAAPSNGTSVSGAAAAVSPESSMVMPRPNQTPSASQTACLQTHPSITSQTSTEPRIATTNTATTAVNRILTGPNASPTSKQEVPTPTSNQAKTVQTNNQQQSMNQQHPTTFAQRQQQRCLEQQDRREQPQQEQGQVGPAIANGAARNLNNLGVTTAKPRYPNYAALAVRSGTFNGFPNHLDQTPIQMARAGFFYAGYGDYVRCFFCGGGLRNWEPGDDPWVEHARWFPRCAHVKQNRGQTFINLVLQRQRELTLPNEYINTTREASSIDSNADSQAQTTRMQANTDRQSNASSAQIRSNTQTGTSTNTLENAQNSTASVSNLPAQKTDQVDTETAATADEMNSPAVLSVKSMGYGDRNIQTAIQHLRNTHVKLTALALLEIIFGLEDIPPETPDETQPCSHSAGGPKAEAGGSSGIKRETNNAESKIEELQTAAAAEASSQHLIPKHKPRGDKPAHSYTEKELKSIQEENSQLKEQMKCKICMDNFVCISFLPCGHLCCCADCAPAMVKCPICRQIVRGSVKTYLS